MMASLYLLISQNSTLSSSSGPPSNKSFEPGWGITLSVFPVQSDILLSNVILFWPPSFLAPMSVLCVGAVCRCTLVDNVDNSADSHSLVSETNKRNAPKTKSKPTRNVYGQISFHSV